MSERLEDYAFDIRNNIPEIIEVLQQKEELSRRVDELEKRNKQLEYASKHNGELNEFLQKRKLPPNTLGRHVVDVVMDYVEDLEKSNKTIKSQTGHNFEVNRKLDAENQRYKQALEDLRVMSQDSVMMKKYWLIIDKALKGESK